MKAAGSTIAIAVLVLGICAGVWLRQRQRDETARQQNAELQSQVRALESELARHSTTVTQKPVEVARLPEATVPVSASAATSVLSNKTAPNPAMLNDPETRALMQKQQEQALSKLADKIVSKDFAHNWNLSSGQATQVKELVREKASVGKDLLNAMMFDGLDDEALAQRGRETKGRLEQADAALRGVLGPDGFKALTEQEHSVEDRERVKHFREELANADQPLAAAQVDSLLAATSVERQAFTFRVDYSDVTKVDFEHVRDYFSEANLQTYFEDMQQLNARIVERASLTLAPAQIEALKAAQNNQMEQARLTVKMTTELFNKRRAN